MANPQGAVPSWLKCALILLVSIPPLLLGTSTRLSTHTMENVALVTSQETWLRLAGGESDAWLVSTNDGKPRLEKPPMLTWLNLLAWSDLDPQTATPQLLTFRARCVTAALGLLMLASIFWLGRSIGNDRIAMLAALSVASTFFFQRQARTASYDIHYVAWTTLAVAAGLWSIHRIGRSPGTLRSVMGWGICSISLAAAAMSKNPLPYLLALPPLIAAIVMLSDRRRRDALSLVATTFISAAPVVAWYWYVFANHREVAEVAWHREVVQPRAGDFQAVYYYLGLFGLVVPWTLWLIGGLIEPFKLADPERRRHAKFALFWFAYIFIVLSIPAAKQQRYILTVMPAVGLLIALFIREHDDRARAEVADRRFELFHAALWIALAIASLLAAALLIWPGMLMAAITSNHADTEALLAPLPWPTGIAIGVILLGICAVGWLWHAARPHRSAVATAVWMLVFMSVYWRQESLIPAARVEQFVIEAQRVRSIVGPMPMVSLRWIETLPGGWDWKINEEFRFYFGRLIPRLRREEFDQWLDQQTEGAYVLVRRDEEASRFLQQRNLTLVDHAQVDRDDQHELWRVP